MVSDALDDAISAGNIGLLRASRGYDPTQGRFSTYATWWIRSFIARHLQDTQSEIRIPVHRRVTHNRILKAQREFTVPVDDAVLAKKAGVSVETIRRDRTAPWRAPVSLSAPVGEHDSTLLDVVADEHAASPEDGRIAEERAAIVNKMLAPLSPRARRVLLRRAQDETFQEIAASLGVTRERIRQIEEKALSRVRLEAHRYAADV